MGVKTLDDRVWFEFKSGWSSREADRGNTRKERRRGEREKKRLKGKEVQMTDDADMKSN